MSVRSGLRGDVLTLLSYHTDCAPVQETSHSVRDYHYSSDLVRCPLVASHNSALQVHLQGSFSLETVYIRYRDQMYSHYI